jgi:hypothetical protein
MPNRTARKMGLRFVTSIVIALSVIGCRPSSDAAEVPGGMTRAEFVRVIEELQRAQPAERAAIYKKRGTSEAEIRAYVAALSTDPTALSQTFDTIQIRMDRERFMDPKKLPEPLEQ